MTKSASTEPDAKSRRFSRYHPIALFVALSIVAVTAIAARKKLPSPQSNDSPKPPQRELKSKHSSSTSVVNPTDIQVPSDMWRRPSEVAGWNPIPLPSCCRDPRTEQKTSKTTAKFLYPTCNLEEETKRYYGPGMQYTPTDLNAAIRNTGGDIIIFGDSVSRQWFESLACYLEAWDNWNGFATPPIEHNRSPFETDVTESFLRYRPEYRPRGNMGYEPKRPNSNFGYFDLPSRSKSAPTQRVIHQNMNEIGITEAMSLVKYYVDRYPEDFKVPPPTIVINIGLHYNWVEEVGPKPKNVRHGIKRTQTDLRNDLAIFRAVCVGSGAKCIFRETSPQHFDSVAGDGLWPVIMTQRDKCMDRPPQSFSTLGRWRNDMIRDIVMANGGKLEKGGYLKVMSIFDKLSGLEGKQHYVEWGRPDCTHWKMDPEIWEAWHISLTEVLVDSVKSVAR